MIFFHLISIQTLPLLIIRLPDDKKAFGDLDPSSAEGPVEISANIVDNDFVNTLFMMVSLKCQKSTTTNIVQLLRLYINLVFSIAPTISRDGWFQYCGSIMVCLAHKTILD